MIADIAVLDADGRDLLFVEVQGMTVSADLLPKILDWMKTEGGPVPYRMIADPVAIYVFKSDGDDPAGASCKFNTLDVLRFYDPEIGEKKRIRHSYLRALIESWLHDFAYHWKSETPPGSEQLAEIGLLPRLSWALARREVPLGADAVR